MAVVMANTTTHISESQQVVAGTLYESDHPIVLAYPHLFETDLLKYAERTPAKEHPIESATASPGEKRTTTRGTNTPEADAPDAT